MSMSQWPTLSAALHTYSLLAPPAGLDAHLQQYGQLAQLMRATVGSSVHPHAIDGGKLAKLMEEAGEQRKRNDNNDAQIHVCMCTACMYHHARRPCHSHPTPVLPTLAVLPTPAPRPVAVVDVSTRLQLPYLYYMHPYYIHYIYPYYILAISLTV